MAECLVKYASFLRSLFAVDHIRRDAGIPIDNDKIALRFSQFFMHTGNKTNWKFETFAFVNRHDLHDIFLIAAQIDFSKIFFALLHSADVAYKLVESLVRSLVKFSCHLQKQFDICLPLQAISHCLQKIHQFGLFQNLL